jgi:hypothetical protein
MSRIRSRTGGRSWVLAPPAQRRSGGMAGHRAPRDRCEARISRRRVGVASASSLTGWHTARG